MKQTAAIASISFETIFFNRFLLLEYIVVFYRYNIHRRHHYIIITIGSTINGVPDPYIFFFLLSIQRSCVAVTAMENGRVDISKAKQIAFKGAHNNKLWGPFISGSTALFTWSDHRLFIHRLRGTRTNRYRNRCSCIFFFRPRFHTGTVIRNMPSAD